MSLDRKDETQPRIDALNSDALNSANNSLDRKDEIPPAIPAQIHNKDNAYQEDQDPLLQSFKQFWNKPIQELIDTFLKEEKDIQKYFQNYQNLMLRVFYANPVDRERINKIIEQLELKNEDALTSRELFMLIINQSRELRGMKRYNGYYTKIKKLDAMKDPMGPYLLGITKMNDCCGDIVHDVLDTDYFNRTLDAYTCYFLSPAYITDLQNAMDKNIYAAAFWLYYPEQSKSLHNFVHRIQTDKKAEEFFQIALSGNDARALFKRFLSPQAKQLREQKISEINKSREMNKSQGAINLISNYVDCLGDLANDIKQLIAAGFPKALLSLAEECLEFGDYKRAFTYYRACISLTNSPNWLEPRNGEDIALLIDNINTKSSLYMQRRLAAGNNSEAMREFILAAKIFFKDIIDEISTAWIQDKELNRNYALSNLVVGSISTLLHLHDPKYLQDLVVYYDTFKYLHILLKDKVESSHVHERGSYIRTFLKNLGDFSKQNPKEFIKLLIQDSICLETFELMIIDIRKTFNLEQIDFFVKLFFDADVINILKIAYPLVIKKIQQDMDEVSHELFQHATPVGRVVLSYLFVGETPKIVEDPKSITQQSGSEDQNPNTKLSQ